MFESKSISRPRRCPSLACFGRLCASDEVDAQMSRRTPQATASKNGDVSVMECQCPRVEDQNEGEVGMALSICAVSVACCKTFPLKVRGLTTWGGYGTRFHSTRTL